MQSNSVTTKSLEPTECFDYNLCMFCLVITFWITFPQPTPPPVNPDRPSSYKQFRKKNWLVCKFTFLWQNEWLFFAPSFVEESLRDRFQKLQQEPPFECHLESSDDFSPRKKCMIWIVIIELRRLLNIVKTSKSERYVKRLKNLKFLSLLNLKYT